MAALLSIPDLSVWVVGLGGSAIEVDDEFAQAMVEAASDAVRTAAKQPTWTASGETAAPSRAKQIASHLAARSYLNPTSIQGEGNLGPLGGDRFVEELAKALHLTEAERDELAGMAPSGSSGGGLWIQPINATFVEDGDIYLPDSSGSDWQIPYLAVDDLPALG